MKRKIFALGLCCVMAFGLMACAADTNDNGADTEIVDDNGEDVNDDDFNNEDFIPETAPLAYGEVPRPQLQPMEPGETIAVMTTNHGDITFRFFPDESPLAVENFLTHAENGYYDGVIFHRVVPGFVIQGGDPEGTGMGGESIWGDVFDNEDQPHMHHFRGALSMANAGPDTNGSQFFIVVNDEPDPGMTDFLESVRDEQDHVIMQNEAGVNVTWGDFFSPEVIDHYLEHGGALMLDQPFNRFTVFGQVIMGMDVADAIAAVPFEEVPDRPGEGQPIDDVIIESIIIMTYEG